MKLNPVVKIRVRNIKALAAQRAIALVRETVLKLAQVRKIETAHVSLEQRPDIAPGYRAIVHLETPGPDIRAEGKDYTPLAAAHRMLKELRRHVQMRNARRNLIPRDRSGHPRVSLNRMMGTCRA
jgi:ribosome-associated translation inhibitor RaiA